MATEPATEYVPLPMTFDGIIDHMVKEHRCCFTTTGRPPTDLDEALESQLESHDRLHSWGHHLHQHSA